MVQTRRERVSSCRPGLSEKVAQFKIEGRGFGPAVLPLDPCM